MHNDMKLPNNASWQYRNTSLYFGVVNEILMVTGINNKVSRWKYLIVLLNDPNYAADETAKWWIALSDNALLNIEFEYCAFNT